MSSDILSKIIARRQTDVAERKRQLPEEQLKRFTESLPPTRGFAAALRDRPGQPPRVIAEIKRASPSKGLIREDFPVVSLARDLADNGAAALSILTEEHYFQGRLRYLRLAAHNVRIPLLRKDFIIDPYQVYEARAFNADAILLIAAALQPDKFGRLHDLARQLGLDVLVEVHNQQELDMVLGFNVQVIGINSRDLKTFKTDLAVVEDLLQQIPDELVKVAESGIRDGADIARMRAAGADAFLIGETLMRATSPGAELASLLGDKGKQ